VAGAAVALLGFCQVWIWRVDERRHLLSTLAALGARNPIEAITLEPGLLRSVSQDRVPRLQVALSRQNLGAPLDLPREEATLGALLPLLSGGQLEGLLLGIWGGDGPASTSGLPTLLTLAAEAALLIRLDRVVQEEERWRARHVTLASQLGVGVAVITRQHDLLYADDRFRQLLGLAPQHASRLSLNRLFPEPAHRDAVERLLAQCWKDARGSSRRGLRLRRPTGSTLSVTLWAQRLALEAEPALQLLLAEGGSEGPASGDQLRAFGLYLAGLANDLRGPLTAYLGHLKLLGDRKDLPENLREAFRLYREVTAQVLARISRTMEWGRRFPVRSPVDLRAIVEAAVATIETSDLPEGAQLSVEAGPVPPISGMADQLQVAIEQLLRNACEALVDRGGTIRVSCTHSGETVSVSVSDSGEGIPPSILPHIFDPFSSTKGVAEGRGLGLAIVQEITARHDGTVEVRSEPGQGTSVALAFPRLREGEARAGRSARGLTVLLVDDDVGIQETYRLLLEHAGYRVVTAMDADEALRQIAAEAPDVLLIDVQLPGRDGVALAEALMKWHPEYLPRSVLHTAYAHEPRVRETARRCGLVVLEKPCDPERLFATLARLGRPERA
jgi:signal transduction histidine kinase/ActR/RegA family two-component response regulator